MVLAEVAMSMFQNYTFILAFLAGLFIGDLVLVLGLFAGAGKTNFWIIILFAFIGGLIHDIIFYFISNSKFAHFIKKKFKLSKKRNKIAHYIERLSNGSYFIPVLIAKYVYGVRDAVILYVAHNEKSLRKYIFTVSPADLIWLFSVTGLGWLAGKGYTSIIPLVQGFEKWIFLVFLGLLVYYLILRIIAGFIFKELTKHTKRLIKTYT
jgi:membrane protein DedA with SNARE-associated domain